MAQIRLAADDDHRACAEIARRLPDYFTADAPATIIRDLAAHRGWVSLVDAGEVVGFVVVERRSERSAEILWIAVRDAYRGSGIGTALLERVIAELAADGVALLEVKTLDRSADYEPYEATTAFYERRGFVQIDTIDPFPDWEPGNPAAIYVAALTPTR